MKFGPDVNTTTLRYRIRRYGKAQPTVACQLFGSWTTSNGRNGNSERLTIGQSLGQQYAILLHLSAPQLHYNVVRIQTKYTLGDSDMTPEVRVGKYQRGEEHEDVSKHREPHGYVQYEL